MGGFEPEGLHRQLAQCRALEGSGNGQFRGASGEIVREPSRIVVLLYDAAKSAAVEEIRAAYRKQFQQESVLRVDAPACVGF